MKYKFDKFKVKEGFGNFYGNLDKIIVYINNGEYRKIKKLLHYCEINIQYVYKNIGDSIPLLEIVIDDACCHFYVTKDKDDYYYLYSIENSNDDSNFGQLYKFDQFDELIDNIEGVISIETER